MGFLRFFLALIVVVHHIPQIPGNKSFPALMGYLDAMVAVLIFYIFSGFYMSLVINRKYAQAAHFPCSFYANRALRIFPLYWLMLLSVFIYYAAVRHGDRVAWIGSQHGFFWFGQMFMNITTLGLDVVPSLGGYTLQLIGPAWSLGAEWLFYLLAPWLVRLNWRRTVALIATVFAIRFGLYHMGCGRYPLRVLFFPLSLGFFMLGHLAYLALARFERSNWLARRADRPWTGVASVGFVLGAGCVLHVGRNCDPETPNLWAFYLLITLLIPLIFITLRRNRIDKFLGDLTFPLYISHILALTVVGDFVTGEVAQRVTALCLSLVLAVLLTLAVEMPVERMRAAFGAWIMRPRLGVPRVLSQTCPPTGALALPHAGPNFLSAGRRFSSSSASDGPAPS